MVPYRLNAKPYAIWYPQQQRLKQGECTIMHKQQSQSESFSRHWIIRNHQHLSKQTTLQPMVSYTTIYIKEDQNHGTCGTTGWEIDKLNNNFFSSGIKVSIMMQIVLQNTILQNTTDIKEIGMYKIEHQPFPNQVYCEGVLLRTMTSPWRHKYPIHIHYAIQWKYIQNNIVTVHYEHTTVHMYWIIHTDRPPMLQEVLAGGLNYRLII